MGEVTNNRDTINLILIMIDRLAHDKDSSVAVTVEHKSDCGVFTEIDPAPEKKASVINSTCEKDLSVLSACNCDLALELVLSKKEDQENTLMLTTTLNELRETFPWLTDNEGAGAILELALMIDETSGLLPTLNLNDFDDSMGQFFLQKFVNPLMSRAPSRHSFCTNSH